MLPQPPVWLILIAFVSALGPLVFFHELGHYLVARLFKIPAELTGLRVPAPGGPSADAVLAAARRVLDTGRVVALDLACTWLPGDRDSTGLRARLLADLVG